MFLKRLILFFSVLVMLFSFSSCDEPDSEVIPHKKLTVSFTETTIVDNEICIFKVVKIDPNSDKGYTLNVSLKNKTKDKTLMFSLDRVSVNGFMCDPYWGCKAGAGEEFSQDVIWEWDKLAKNSITEPTDIELFLRVYDYDEWGKEDYCNETFVIFPKGQKASKPPEHTVDENAVIIFDNDNCSMTVSGYSFDEASGFTVNAVLENKSENKTLMYAIEKATINGETLTPYWSYEVAAGKRANTTINWTPKQLEEDKVTKILDVEFLMRVFDVENANGKHLVNQTYSLSPDLTLK